MPNKIDPPTPRLRVVSENDAKALARDRALGNIDFAIRDLAANLMRVTRGAGKAVLLFRQCTELAKSMSEYHEITGHLPEDFRIQKALSVRSSMLDDIKGEDNLEWTAAIDEMLHGALQMAASRLVHQISQEQAGESQLLAGARRIQLSNEKRNAKFKMEMAAQRAAKKSTNKRKRVAKSKGTKSKFSSPLIIL
jgi:hypothetical protein